jgi:hypothetical protein
MISEISGHGSAGGSGLRRTNGQLAIDIPAEAFADGGGLDVICGDEVYGSCTELCEFCEGPGLVLVPWERCHCAPARVAHPARAALGALDRRVPRARMPVDCGTSRGMTLALAYRRSTATARRACRPPGA